MVIDETVGDGRLCSPGVKLMCCGEMEMSCISVTAFSLISHSLA